MIRHHLRFSRSYLISGASLPGSRPPTQLTVPPNKKRICETYTIWIYRFKYVIAGLFTKRENINNAIPSFAFELSDSSCYSGCCRLVIVFGLLMLEHRYFSCFLVAAQSGRWRQLYCVSFRFHWVEYRELRNHHFRPSQRNCPYVGYHASCCLAGYILRRTIYV